MGVDNFSVRWSGDFTFAAGAYTFTATADDGVRVFLDDQLIIDEWRGQAPTTFEATRTLTAGTHAVKDGVLRGHRRRDRETRLGGGVDGVRGRSVLGRVLLGDRVGWGGNVLALRGRSARQGVRIGRAWDRARLDDFSARWSGEFTFAAGAYTFTATADDGVRVFLDDQLIIDEWRGQSPTTFEATRTLTRARTRSRMEYYEATGGATAKLDWAAESTACAAGRYSAEYFSGTELAGAATFSRCEDAPINKEYGRRPRDWAGVDDFSARWSGEFTFAAGAYTFTATADDGVRVSWTAS